MLKLTRLGKLHTWRAAAIPATIFLYERFLQTPALTRAIVSLAVPCSGDYTRQLDMSGRIAGLEWYGNLAAVPNRTGKYLPWKWGKHSILRFALLSLEIESGYPTIQRR